MERQTAITVLRQYQPQLTAAGAAALYLFGSTARGDADTVSDLDVAIDIDRTQKPDFSLLDLSRIGLLVQDATGLPTDVVVRGDLNRLRQAFAKEAVRVY